jgi:hypothetical protein
MNLLDIYLSMNSCVREGKKIYFVDPMDNTKKEYVGDYLDHKIEGHDLTISVRPVKPVEFICVKVELSNEKE